MAFPFVFESTFEQGTNAEWDSETDTAAQLDFPHFSELARFRNSNSAPYTGAYCMRAVLSGGTADAFVTEGDMNIAAAGVAFLSFNVMFDSDFDATADDTVHLFEFQGAANAIQAVIGFRYVAATDVINIGFGELTPTGFAAAEIQKNTWYTIELRVDLDAGGGNDGTLDLYITREGDDSSEVISATQITALDQIAVTHGILGILNHLATTTGTILFDRLIMDDARVYPLGDRYVKQVLITKDSHVFLGRGELEHVSLLSGAGTDNILTLYDTNTAKTNSPGNILLELKNTANNQVVENRDNIDFTRGVYAVMTGTNPRASIQVRQAPNSMSVGNVRRLGLRQS